MSRIHAYAFSATLAVIWYFAATGAHLDSFWIFLGAAVIGVTAPGADRRAA